MLRTFVSRLPHPSSISVGFHQDAHRSRQPTSQSSTPLGSALLSLMDLITNSLGTPRPVLVKWSRGVVNSPFVLEYEAAEVWMWHFQDQEVQEQRWLDTQTCRAIRDDEGNVPNLPLRYWTTSLATSRGQKDTEWSGYHVLQIWHTPASSTSISTATAATSSTTSPPSRSEPLREQPIRTIKRSNTLPLPTTTSSSRRPPPQPPATSTRTTARLPQPPMPMPSPPPQPPTDLHAGRTTSSRSRERSHPRQRATSTSIPRPMNEDDADMPPAPQPPAPPPPPPGGERPSRHIRHHESAEIQKQGTSGARRNGD
eukprot:2958405-Amphidinium_carterae.4